MFVYALKISEPSRTTDAYERLKAQFDLLLKTYEEAAQADGYLIVFTPQRNGELTFERDLKALGQSFTTLSRSGLKFSIQRQRFDGEYKQVADYSQTLKMGRHAWRAEKLRVNAASDSLESFLCQEANSEDMEVLRPLFPLDVNNLLKDDETGVMKGSEMLMKVFPSMKGSDARRVFYQMQLLFETRASKWKNRLGCAWVSVYFIMAVLVIYAVFEWLNISLGLHGLIAAPIAMVLGLVPVIGSIIAYITATNTWNWSNSTALIVLFWYYLPILYVIVTLTVSIIRGEGKAAWDRLPGHAKRSNDDTDQE